MKLVNDSTSNIRPWNKLQINKIWTSYRESKANLLYEETQYFQLYFGFTHTYQNNKNGILVVFHSNIIFVKQYKVCLHELKIEWSYRKLH